MLLTLFCLRTILLLQCSWWIVGGLGARGLVYHAWLGKLLAQAILEDSEDGLPCQLLRWKLSKQSSI